jgi:hypothetical protein
MRRSSRTTRHAGFKPSVEALESRWCPSGASIQLTGHTLVVHGDSAADQISVVDNGKGGVSASITTPHGTLTGGASGVQAITIESGDSGDHVSFALSGQLTSALSLKLCLGKGSDTANLDFTAGIAGLGPATRMLDVDIDHGSGSDRVTTTFGAISSAAIDFDECLGSGNDHATVQFQGALTNVRADVTVKGGDGDQTTAVSFAGISNSSVSLTENLGRDDGNTWTTTFAGPISGSQTAVRLDGGRADGSMSLTVGEVDGGSFSLRQCQGDGTNMKSTVAFNGPLNGTTLTANLEGDEAGKCMAMSFGAINGGSVRVSDDLGDGASSTNHVNFNGTISNASVAVDADYEPGRDAFFVQLGNVVNSTVDVEGCMGAHDATFEADLLGSLTASKVTIHARGRGNDHYVLNALGVNVDAASELDLIAGADRGNETATLTYEGVMNGILKAVLDGGATGNTEAERITLDAGSTGSVRAVVDGGAGNDALTLNVFDNSGGTLARLAADLYEAGGLDTINVTSNVHVHA